LKFEWDNLIILDSCRYDYFEEEYPNYLNGSLMKALSAASCTIDYMKKVWSGYYDITYVSAMPGINSKGIARKGYNAKYHFKKIIDVWQFGWDDVLGSVPPWAFLDIIETTAGYCVFHFMQPHQPYIGNKKLTYYRPVPSGERIPEKYRTAGMILDAIKAGEFTIDYMQEAYRDNLRLALEWIAKMPFHGITIISSDHGEWLCENHSGVKGRLWHPCGKSNSILRHVPWFVMK
jgi:hypothetical protein